MKYNYDKDFFNEKISDFLYGCSLHDAILQKAFKAKDKRWVGKVVEAKTVLRKYIDKILNEGFPSQEEHDDIFLKTADGICKAINGKKTKGVADQDFSFGNAQKLINITAKHFYTICYLSTDLRENFRYCHCPLDSIMLGKVWKLYENLDRNTYLGTQTAFCKAWGNEGLNGNTQPAIKSYPDRYDRFQKAIRNLIKVDGGDIFPIEFDYKEWVK